MKNLLISAFAFSLAMAAPTALLAQDDHHDHPAPHGPASTPPDHGTPAGGDHRDMDHHTTPATGGGMGGGMTGSTHHTSHHHTTTVTNHTTTRVKIDVTSYHKNFTAPHAYHYGDYHGPAGYSYHRWSYGDSLPREYWAQNYWINNDLNFGLIAPPDGYVWVRYGPDAVLIDEDTGEIVQVEYGVFY
jgi:Ni/Co efflux regulator RcnB